MSFQRASGEIRVSFFCSFFRFPPRGRSISDMDLIPVYGWVLNSLFNKWGVRKVRASFFLIISD